MQFDKSLAFPVAEPQHVTQLLIDLFDGKVLNTCAEETTVAAGGFELHLEHSQQKPSTVWLSVQTNNRLEVLDKLTAFNVKTTAVEGETPGTLVDTQCGLRFFLTQA